MIRCLIVDDEPLARDLLQGYVGDVPGLQLVGSCKSAVEAFGLLHEQQIDLMFLDINMPGITGLNFLRSLNEPPAVIFTTAYAEYAVEAFELEALDYLLKPITPERFLKAVQKILSKKADLVSKPVQRPGSIFLKVDKKLVNVEIVTIRHVEALGDYVKIHLENKTLVTHSSITKIEDLLPKEEFIRVHRSYLVSLKHIQFIEGNFLKVNNIEIPIGTTYRDSVLSRINAGEQ